MAIKDAPPELFEVDKEVLAAEHPLVEHMKDEWQFFLDAYEGGKPWRDGRHLFQYAREDGTDWEKRLERAYYVNYCAPIIDIPIGHLFKREIVRDIKGDAALKSEFDGFLENVDGVGTTQTQLSREAKTLALIMGFCPVLLDMPTSNTRPQSLDDQRKMGLTPYATLINPLNLVNWSQSGLYYPASPNGVNRGSSQVYRGHLGPLAGEGIYTTSGVGDPNQMENPWAINPCHLNYKPDWIRFLEEGEGDSNPFPGSGEREMVYRTWTTEWWSKHDKDGKLLDFGENPCKGEIPLAVYYAERAKRFPFIGLSAIREIAYMNLGTYNYDSQIDKMIYEVMFPMLSQPREDTSDEDILEIDSTMLWEFPADARHPPAYLSPSSEPLNAISAKRAEMVREMFRLAKLSSVITTEKRVAESGLKQAFDFEETNQYIADLAASTERTEYEMARIWGKMLRGVENPGKRELTIRYPRKFDILSVNDALTQALIMIHLAMPGKFWKLMKKDLVMKVLQRTGAKNDEILAALESVEAQPDNIMEQLAMAGAGGAQGRAGGAGISSRQTTDIIDKGIKMPTSGSAPVTAQ